MDNQISQRRTHVKAMHDIRFISMQIPYRTIIGQQVIDRRQQGSFANRQIRHEARLVRSAKIPPFNMGLQHKCGDELLFVHKIIMVKAFSGSGDDAKYS
jgi:hypothetical protein